MKITSKYIYALLIFILLGGFAVRMYKINSPVADWHSWRQVDTASVSLNFVQHGVNLLVPRYHDISSIQSGYTNPEGYRFVEFPLFNLFHAVLYSAFPIVSFDVWGRLVSVFASILTALFLFGIGRKISGQGVGLLAAFFYSFLPFNIYFTRTILPDTLSTMLAVASVFFFMSYTERAKLYQLLLSAGLFALAMLVKPHAVFFGVAILYILLQKSTLSDIFKNRWLFIAANIVLVPFLLWRIWIAQEGFIRGIPFWEWAFNGTGIRFRPAFWRWIFVERLGILILGVWGAFPFAYGVASGRKKTFLVHAFLAGAVIYMVVFASANVMHDYYQIFIIPAVALALAVGTSALWNSRELRPAVARPMLLFSILMMFAVGVYGVKDNYRINDPGIVAAGEEVDRLVPKDALVIAAYGGDTTFLYQTRRSGWPIITTSIDRMIAEGAGYYVSVDFSTQDTINFSKRFETLHQTDGFIILDLSRRKANP